MRKIALAEFQQLTGISTETLGTLLISASLPCSVDATGNLLVDLEALKIQRLVETINKIKRQTLRDHKLLFDAEVQSVLRNEFEGIVREALGRYLQFKHGE